MRFWFDEIEPAQWWKKDQAFDQLVVELFSTTHAQARQNKLFEWRETAIGRLAEIIVLDQFSRNMFRNKAASFASDSLALSLAQEAISSGAEVHLSAVQRSFLYMPFMHSESIEIQKMSITLFKQNGIAGSLNSAMQHQEIVQRFGRYPHRNAILGRVSTTEEIQFLSQPGSSF